MEQADRNHHQNWNQKNVMLREMQPSVLPIKPQEILISGVKMQMRNSMARHKRLNYNDWLHYVLVM